MSIIIGLLIGFGTDSICLGFAAFFLIECLEDYPQKK